MTENIESDLTLLQTYHDVLKDIDAVSIWYIYTKALLTVINGFLIFDLHLRDRMQYLLELTHTLADESTWAWCSAYLCLEVTDIALIACFNTF